MYDKEEQDDFRKLARLFKVNHLGIVGDRGREAFKRNR